MIVEAEGEHKQYEKQKEQVLQATNTRKCNIRSTTTKMNAAIRKLFKTLSTNSRRMMSKGRMQKY